MPLARLGPVRVACTAQQSATGLPEPVDLQALWGLALTQHPGLREAEADLEAARGRRIQAGKCPNPQLLYEQDTIGAAAAPQGNFKVAVSQEVVTAGKRRLDREVAGRGQDRAALAMLGRQQEVLSRLRRGYYDYVSWVAAEQANKEIVTALEQGVSVIRQLVEKAKTRPRTDRLRGEAILGEARIGLARAHTSRLAAWRELAIEVGRPDLPPPQQAKARTLVPRWSPADVEARVQGTNTALREAEVQVDQARVAWQRAKAEVVPNIRVGAGYTLSNIEHAAGALVSIETSLPLWDAKQGLVYEAQAGMARAQASLRVTQNRLASQTTKAFAAYEAAHFQALQLDSEVIPRLQESWDLLRKGYFEAGAKEIAFLDVLQAQQALVAARLALVEARRSLWLAIADLEMLMQLDLDEELPAPPPDLSR
jgi:outer membrane protein TolC